MNVVTSVVPLRPKDRKLSDRGGTPARRLAGRVGSLMWLPAGVATVEAFMVGGLPRLLGLDGWLYLAGLAVGGIPLAWACGRLRRMGYGGECRGSIDPPRPCHARFPRINKRNG